MLKKLTDNPSLIALIFSFLLCACLALAGITSRPLFPVDETRYVSVAWEMYSRGDWILPTLNYEAYHHKPSLLFWLIMSLWSVFGVSQEVAMVVPYLIAFGVAAALIRFVKSAVPENASLPLLSAAILTGSLPFVVYGNLIMFDMLLSIFVLTGMTAIWQFSRTGKAVHIALFGLSVGLGVLSKGPVVLLHLLFPVVLAPFWISKDRRIMSWGKWAGSLSVGIFLGAFVALSWAIPAAIKGGPEFTEKIFWGQTAGRMSKSFDHGAPFWWYFMFLPVFFLPWGFHAGFWKGLKGLRLSDSPPVLRMLACWIIPAFVSFCLVSGKQVHYLLPLLPGLSVVLALTLHHARDTIKPSHALPALVICALLALIPAIANLSAGLTQDVFADHRHVTASFDKMSPLLSVFSAAIIAGIAFLGRRHGLTGQVCAISVSMMIFISCFMIEAKSSFFPNYDLTPIADVIRKNPGRPLAFARNYHGEWGFLARLNRPVKQLDLHELPGWFDKNPAGMAFIRTRREEEFSPYDVIYSQPYKMTNTYAVVVPKGRGSDFLK